MIYNLSQNWLFFDEDFNSLWTKFSMLRKELIVKKKIRSDEKFVQLQQYLKQVEKNYQPKKSKVLTREQVLKFLQQAPTEKYFLEKGILVIGVFGAGRRDEFVKMRFTDVRDMSAHVIIDITQSKNGQSRSFFII
jgi:integrase